ESTFAGGIGAKQHLRFGCGSSVGRAPRSRWRNRRRRWPTAPLMTPAEASPMVGKGLPWPAQSFQLEDALQHTCLISAAGASASHYEAECVFHALGISIPSDQASVLTGAGCAASKAAIAGACCRM